jgi:hypothetical protein
VIGAGGDPTSEVLVLHDSAPDLDGAREASPGPSGLTRFLAEVPASADVSRETLIEAVHALLRERDYLRRARDLQLADFELASSAQRRHAGELEQLLHREAQASREQADGLMREMAALREEVQRLLRERDEILADRAAVRADRDAWRTRAEADPAGRFRKKLRRLAGRWSWSTRENGHDTRPSPPDERIPEPEAPGIRPREERRE